MTERIRIPRGDALAAGTWCIGPGGALLHRCPQCKRGSEMLNHSVSTTGDVHASIACFPPCTYHVWGVLEGWTHGEKRAGEKVQPPF